MHYALRLTVVFLFTAFAAASHAAANQDTIVHPSGLSFRLDEWTLTAVLQSDGTNVSVKGVLSLRDKDSATGANIVSVWYENPGVEGAEWAATAWESQDQWDAIKTVKQWYQISNYWDFLWRTMDTESGLPPSEVPKEFYNGLFIDDPLYDLVTEDEREVIIAFLDGIGYQAADILIEEYGQGWFCQPESILWSYAEATKFDVVAPDATDTELLSQPFAGVLITCAQITPAPAPPPPPPPPACGTWGCVPGTTIPLPGPSLNPGGGWERGPKAPRFNPGCTTATSCCYDEQIRYYYWKDGVLGFVVRHCESTISYSCPAPTSGAPCPPFPSCNPAGMPPFSPLLPVNCGKKPW